jgi:hypothetical protein
MAVYEVKAVEMVKDGKRNVKVANMVRASAFDKVIEVLKAAGFEAGKAANGDIYFPLVTDKESGEVYNLRLAVSLSSKDIDTKAVRKGKVKVADPVEVPDLFGEMEDAE